MEQGIGDPAGRHIRARLPEGGRGGRGTGPRISAQRRSVHDDVLGLGSDVIKIAGTSHDVELAEARGLASWKWSRLLDLEGQVKRDEQNLAARPKTRPAQVADETLPDRTLKQRNAAYEQETKDLHAGFADLKEQARAERRELESYIVKSKSRR
jgi:hypothetical protein